MSFIVSVASAPTGTEARFVTRSALAKELGVSVRTLYDRDIDLGRISWAYRQIRAGSRDPWSPEQILWHKKYHYLLCQGLNISSVKECLKNDPDFIKNVTFTN